MHPYVPPNNSNFNNLSIDIIEDLTRMVTDELIDELARLENDSEINLQPATTEQIDSLEKIINKDKQDIFCAICQDQINIGDTYSCMPCNKHFYHSHCIQEWLTRDNSCPICRIPIETHHTGNRENTENTENTGNTVNTVDTVNSGNINDDFFVTIIFPDGSILYKSFNKNITIKEFLDKINNYLVLDLPQMEIIFKNLSSNEKINYNDIMNESIEKVNITNGSQIKLIK